VIPFESLRKRNKAKLGQIFHGGSRENQSKPLLGYCYRSGVGI
jgi:hypothetical protein